MKTIEQIQNEIIEEFSIFEDWMNKYEYIIDLGKKLDPLPEEFKKDEFLIKGCQSKVWLVPFYKNGILEFKADSDAIITKGLISLIIRIYNNQKPEDIVNSNLFFIEKIGLLQNLTPSRANGLKAMVEKIHFYAKNLTKTN